MFVLFAHYLARSFVPMFRNSVTVVVSYCMLIFLFLSVEDYVEPIPYKM